MTPAPAGVIADLGQTPNSSVTIQHLVANKPEVLSSSVVPLSLSPAAWVDFLLLLASCHASSVTACMAGPTMTCFGVCK